MTDRLASSRMKKRGSQKVGALVAIGDPGLEPNPYENDPRASHHLSDNITTRQQKDTTQFQTLPAVARIPNPNHNFTQQISFNNTQKAQLSPAKDNEIHNLDHNQVFNTAQKLPVTKQLSPNIQKLTPNQQYKNMGTLTPGVGLDNHKQSSNSNTKPLKNKGINGNLSHVYQRKSSNQDNSKSELSQKRSIFQQSHSEKFGIKKSKKVVISTGISKEEKQKIIRAKELDPSIREYQFPDFGFHDDLNLRGTDKDQSLWTYLADYISQFPRFERMRSVINDSQELKQKSMQKEINQRLQKKLRDNKQRFNLNRNFEVMTEEEENNLMRQDILRQIEKEHRRRAEKRSKEAEQMSTKKVVNKGLLNNQQTDLRGIHQAQTINEGQNNGQALNTESDQKHLTFESISVSQANQTRNSSKEPNQNTQLTADLPISLQNQKSQAADSNQQTELRKNSSLRLLTKSFMSKQKMQLGSKFKDMKANQNQLMDALKVSQTWINNIKLQFNLEDLTQKIEDLESQQKASNRILQANPTIKELNDYLFNSVAQDKEIRKKIEKLQKQRQQMTKQFETQTAKKQEQEQKTLMKKHYVSSKNNLYAVPNFVKLNQKRSSLTIFDTNVQLGHNTSREWLASSSQQLLFPDFSQSVKSLTNQHHSKHDQNYSPDENNNEHIYVTFNQNYHLRNNSLIDSKQQRSGLQSDQLYQNQNQARNKISFKLKNFGTRQAQQHKHHNSEQPKGVGHIYNNLSGDTAMIGNKNDKLVRICAPESNSSPDSSVQELGDQDLVYAFDHQPHIDIKFNQDASLTRQDDLGKQNQPKVDTLQYQALQFQSPNEQLAKNNNSLQPTQSQLLNQDLISVQNDRDCLNEGYTQNNDQEQNLMADYTNRVFLDQYKLYKLQKLYMIYLMSDNHRGLEFIQTQPFKDFIRNQQKFQIKDYSKSNRKLSNQFGSQTSLNLHKGSGRQYQNIQPVGSSQTQNQQIKRLKQVSPALVMPSLESHLHRIKLRIMDMLVLGLDRLRNIGIPARHCDISALQTLRQAAFHRIDCKQHFSLLLSQLIFQTDEIQNNLSLIEQLSSILCQMGIQINQNNQQKTQARNQYTQIEMNQSKNIIDYDNDYIQNKGVEQTNNQIHKQSNKSLQFQPFKLNLSAHPNINTKQNHAFQNSNQSVANMIDADCNFKKNCLPETHMIQEFPTFDSNAHIGSSLKDNNPYQIIDQESIQQTSGHSAQNFHSDLQSPPIFEAPFEIKPMFQEQQDRQNEIIQRLKISKTSRNQDVQIMNDYYSIDKQQDPSDRFPSLTKFSSLANPQQIQKSIPNSFSSLSQYVNKKVHRRQPPNMHYATSRNSIGLGFSPKRNAIEPKQAKYQSQKRNMSTLIQTKKHSNEFQKQLGPLNSCGNHQKAFVSCISKDLKIKKVNDPLGPRESLQSSTDYNQISQFDTEYLETTINNELSMRERLQKMKNEERIHLKATMDRFRRERKKREQQINVKQLRTTVTNHYQQSNIF